MSKIIEGAKDAAAVARCNPHQFKFVTYHTVGGGAVGICLNCNGRFTAWPGTIYYDEIVAARERQRVR